MNLSRLAIRQAYLAGVEALDASLAGAHLAETVLAEVFSLPNSVALSGDGALLTAGTSTGEVWLWRVADRALVATLEGHIGGVWGVALSADGRLVTSGGFGGTALLWEAQRGTPLHMLRSDRRYERLDITGLTGVSEAQRAALLALGAVERGA